MRLSSLAQKSGFAPKAGCGKPVEVPCGPHTGWMFARWFLLLALVWWGPGARAEETDVVRAHHKAVSGVNSTNNMATGMNVGLRNVQDQLTDLLPTSTGDNYYSITAGNTYGYATKATKASWVDKSINWVVGRISGISEAMKSGTDRASKEVEKSITWIDEHIAPEFYLSPEQVQNFRRAIQAYRLYRQMDVMAKSWRGSLFKIDLLDVMPVFQQAEYDEFGLPRTGIRVGLKYKDKVAKEDILSANGLDNPFVGDWDHPIVTYKGPRKWSDVSFDLVASPYQGQGDSEPLSALQAGNKFIDQVWFEGVVGGAGLWDGLKYGANVQDTRMSPKILKENAQRVGDARLSDIQREIQSLIKLGISPVEATKRFQAEIDFWANVPGDIYDNQVARINRLRDMLVPATNDIKKLEGVEHAKDESDPLAVNFLEKSFNTVRDIWGAVGSGNDVTGNEPDGNEGPWVGGTKVNSGPRMQFKANVAYAKATHAAWLEAQAIRRLLHSSIKSRAQHLASDGYLRLIKTLERRQGDAIRAELSAERYNRTANRVLTTLEGMELNLGRIQSKARIYAKNVK